MCRKGVSEAALDCVSHKWFVHRCKPLQAGHKTNWTALNAMQNARAVLTQTTHCLPLSRFWYEARSIQSAFAACTSFCPYVSIIRSRRKRLSWPCSTPEHQTNSSHPNGCIVHPRSQISTALAMRYRNAEETGKAHDIKGSGVMHPLSSEVIKSCLPTGQVKAFPANCLSLMTISGAKGSLVNFSQISCLLGQQVCRQ